MLPTNPEGCGPQEAPSDELPNLLRAHAEQGRRRLSQLEKAVADTRRQIQDLAVTTEAELTSLRSRVSPAVAKTAEEEELSLRMRDNAAHIASGGNAGACFMTLKAEAVKAVQEEAGRSGQGPDPFLSSALELIEAAFQGLESSMQRVVAFPETLTAENAAERERLRGEFSTELEQAEGRLREEFTNECAKVHIRVDESMRFQKDICQQRLLDGLEEIRREHTTEIQAAARKCEMQLEQANELRAAVQSEVMIELDKVRREIEISRQTSKAAPNSHRQPPDEGRPVAVCSNNVLPEANVGSRDQEITYAGRAARDPLAEPAPEPAGALGPGAEAAAAVAAGHALAEAALHFDVVSSELKTQAEALAKASEARISTAEAAFSTELHQVHRALSACAVQLQALQEGVSTDIKPRMAKLEAAVTAARSQPQTPWPSCATSPSAPAVPQLQGLQTALANTMPASPIVLSPQGGSGSWSGIAAAAAAPLQIQRRRRMSKGEEARTVVVPEGPPPVLWPPHRPFVEADKANTAPSSRTQSPLMRRSAASLLRAGDVEHSPRFTTMANARLDWRNTFNTIMRTSSPPPASRRGSQLPANTDD